jgi:peptide/nickel transport system permease protein
MIKYVIRRLVQAIPTFFGITILSYALMAATPGGPVAALAFGAGLKNEKEVERLKVQLGVNDPWVIQYLRWLLGDDWMRWDSDGDGIADHAIIIPLDANNDGEPEAPGTNKGILRGDFGRSFVFRRPALDVLVERLPATLELGISSLVIGATVGIIVGILAAVNHKRLFDHFSRVAAVIFDAIPVFWLALILLLFFGKTLGLLPLGNRCKPALDDSCPPIYDRIQYLILPTFVLATGLIGAYSRFARASMLDVVSQDFIRTARAKGLNERVIWFRHGARNALIPIATFLGPAITAVLGGAVITEKIFSWPGVGLSVVNAVTSRDFPIVMVVVIYSAISTIIGFLISDILYVLIDPRIRLD